MKNSYTNNLIHDLNQRNNIRDIQQNLNKEIEIQVVDKDLSQNFDQDSQRDEDSIDFTSINSNTLPIQCVFNIHEKLQKENAYTISPITSPNQKKLKSKRKSPNNRDTMKQKKRSILQRVNTIRKLPIGTLGKIERFQVMPPCFNKDYGIIFPFKFQDKNFLPPLPFVDAIKVLQYQLHSDDFFSGSELNEWIKWLTDTNVFIKEDSNYIKSKNKSRAPNIQDSKNKSNQNNIDSIDSIDTSKSFLNPFNNRNRSNYFRKSIGDKDQNILKISHLDVEDFRNKVDPKVSVAEILEKHQKKNQFIRKDLNFSIISKSNHDDHILLNCQYGFIRTFFHRLIDSMLKNNFVLQVGFVRTSCYQCFDYNYECVKQYHLKNDPLWNNYNMTPSSDNFVKYEFQSNRMDSTSLWYQCCIDSFQSFEDIYSKWCSIQPNCNFLGHDIMSIRILPDFMMTDDYLLSETKDNFISDNQVRELIILDLAQPSNSSVTFDPNFLAVKTSLSALSKILYNVSNKRSYIRFKEDPITMILEKSLSKSDSHFGSSMIVIDIDNNLALKNQTKEVISFGLNATNIKPIELTDFEKTQESTSKKRSASPSKDSDIRPRTAFSISHPNLPSQTRKLYTIKPNTESSKMNTDQISNLNSFHDNTNSIHSKFPILRDRPTTSQIYRKNNKHNEMNSKINESESIYTDQISETQSIDRDDLKNDSLKLIEEPKVKSNKKKRLKPKNDESIIYNHDEWAIAMKKMKEIRKATIILSMLTTREQSIIYREKALYQIEEMAENFYLP